MSSYAPVQLQLAFDKSLQHKFFCDLAKPPYDSSLHFVVGGKSMYFNSDIMRNTNFVPQLVMSLSTWCHSLSKHSPNSVHHLYFLSVVLTILTKYCLPCNI